MSLAPSDSSPNPHQAAFIPWQTPLVLLACVAILSALQVRGRAFTGSPACRLYDRISPLRCIFDGIFIILKLLLLSFYCTPLLALRIIAHSRYSGCSRLSPLGKLRAKAWFRWGYFFALGLPAFAKLLSLQTAPWTKTWAWVFMLSFLMEEFLVAIYPGEDFFPIETESDFTLKYVDFIPGLSKNEQRMARLEDILSGFFWAELVAWYLTVLASSAVIAFLSHASTIVPYDKARENRIVMKYAYHIIILIILVKVDYTKDMMERFWLRHPQIFWNFGLVKPVPGTENDVEVVKWWELYQMFGLFQIITALIFYEFSWCPGADARSASLIETLVGQGYYNEILTWFMQLDLTVLLEIIRAPPTNFRIPLYYLTVLAILCSLPPRKGLITCTWRFGKLTHRFYSRSSPFICLLDTLILLIRTIFTSVHLQCSPKLALRIIAYDWVNCNTQCQPPPHLKDPSHRTAIHLPILLLLFRLTLYRSIPLTKMYAYLYILPYITETYLYSLTTRPIPKTDLKTLAKYTSSLHQSQSRANIAKFRKRLKKLEIISLILAGLIFGFHATLIVLALTAANPSSTRHIFVIHTVYDLMRLLIALLAINFAFKILFEAVPRRFPRWFVWMGLMRFKDGGKEGEYESDDQGRFGFYLFVVAVGSAVLGYWAWFDGVWWEVGG